jgi:glutaminase
VDDDSAGDDGIPAGSAPAPSSADDPVPFHVSTGDLPSPLEIGAAVLDGYERYRRLDDGKVADYIPALACASRDAFGVCVAGVGGRTFAVGDAELEFTIQSISKVFVFALVCEVIGCEEARGKLGVNSTGLPFDSVMGIELNDDRTMNPMVNAGALATASLVPGATIEDKFSRIVDMLSCFAGRRLDLDEEVYES